MDLPASAWAILMDILKILKLGVGVGKKGVRRRKRARRGGGVTEAGISYG